MLQTLERTRRDSRGTKASTAPAKVITRPAEANIEQDDGLIATAGPIMMAAYAVVLIAAVLTFKGNWGSPARGRGQHRLCRGVLRRAAAHDGHPRPPRHALARGQSRAPCRHGRYLHRPRRRTEAILHMVIVPLVVSAGFVCFAAIWVLVRP